MLPEVAAVGHPRFGPTKTRRRDDEQILTTYVLDNVLLPDLPDDAAAMIAFTASDLWPGEGWNFVYGQASTSDRVGVWSINRNGDPDAGEAEFRLCLLRAMKTATHETGHMFSLCALHAVRVRHVRQQQPQRKRSPAAGSLP